MLLYKCTSCQEFIQVTKARLTCSTCSPPITLCANCYVVQDYPLQHPDGASHSLSVYQHSGYLPVPPPPPVRTKSIGNVYTSAPVPPRRRPVSTVDSEMPPRKPPRPTVSEEKPELDAGEPVSRPVSTQPPTPLSPGAQQQSTEQEYREQKQQQQQPQLPRQNLQDHQPSPSQHSRPNQNPSPQPQQQQHQSQYHQEQPQYQQPQQHQQHQHSGWTYFFNQDMSPTPCFSALIKEFFHHLDPKRTGLLSPETCSEYIDACGAPANHNIWKASRAKSPQYGYDLADRELADHYTSYGVDFILHPRTPPSTPTASPLNPLSYIPAAQRTIMEQFISAPPSVSGNRKPMLTLHGWTSLSICGALLNPSAAWGELNRAMRHYRLPLWTKWGDIPREMLPLAPHQAEVERVRIMHDGAQINAERELDSLQARLLLEKQGRQNALELLDDRRYVYR